jgi:hypothetical protein
VAAPLSLIARILLAASLASVSAAADPPRLHGSAAAARAVTGHQKRELGFGAAGILAVEVPVAGPLGMQAEAGSLWLSEGSKPDDPEIAPGGAASSLHGALGARLHASTEPGGPWLLASAGIARTGQLVRNAARSRSTKSSAVLARRAFWSV